MEVEGHDYCKPGSYKEWDGETPGSGCPWRIKAEAEIERLSNIEKMWSEQNVKLVAENLRLERWISNHKDEVTDLKEVIDGLERQIAERTKMIEQAFKEACRWAPVDAHMSWLNSDVRKRLDGG